MCNSFFYSKGNGITFVVCSYVKSSLPKRIHHFCTKSSSENPSEGLLAQHSTPFLNRKTADVSTYASFLRSPVVSRSLSDGQKVHNGIVLHGYDGDFLLGNLIVQMYVRCTHLDDARFCFDSLHDRSLFTWNFLLKAYDGLGFYKEVLYLFAQMLQENIIPDKCSYVCILSAYASNPSALCQAKSIHCCVLNVGLNVNFIVATALINLYGKSHDLEHACSAFESLIERDIVSWNALIAAYGNQGLDIDTIQIFYQLHQEGYLPDRVTLVHTLCSFARPSMLICGKRIHASLYGQDIERNVVVSTALANMYGKCGSLKCALQFFEQMEIRNIVTWNAMITVLAQHEHGKEALQLFKQMKLEDMVSNKVTFVSALDACGTEKCLNEGLILHTLMTKFGFDVDVIVGTALVNMYNKCNCLQEGQRIFDLLQERNVITWNVMITGYVHHGFSKEALQLFDRMEKEKIALDDLSTVGILSACGLEAALTRGQIMHAFALQCGFELGIVAANTILNMYGKCGCVDDAQMLFERMQERSLVSWNSVLAVHAQHGNDEMVVKLFCDMQVKGVAPNENTLSNIMCMGSHSGSVRECISFWLIMINECAIYPTAEHLDSILDMLGRAGQLDEAEFLIDNMPIQPSALSWTTLLSSCRNSADVIRGKLAAETSIELDTGDEVTYITLSNIYAASGSMDQVHCLHM